MKGRLFLASALVAIAAIPARAQVSLDIAKDNLRAVYDGGTSVAFEGLRDVD
jgi:hypothetical protein